MKTALNEHNYQIQIKNLIAKGLSNEAIMVNYESKGFDESELKELQMLVQKIRNKKRTETGSVLVLIGIIILGLGFISCLLLHYLGNDINFWLYGLTGVGALALFMGLILIFS